MAPAACECSGSFFIGSQMKQIKLIAMRRVGVIGSQMKQMEHAVSPMKRGTPSGKGNFGSQMKQMEQSHAACRGISPKLSKMIQKKLSVFKTKSAKSIIFVKKCRNIWSCQKKAVPLHPLFVGSSSHFLLTD